MNDLDSMIENFGRGIGIPDLRFNQHNVIRLDIERTGSLYIENRDSLVLIYMAIEVLPHQKDLFIKAMQLCHFRENPPYNIAVGYKPDDKLLLIIRLPHIEITPAALDEIGKLLFYYYESIWHASA